MRTIITAALLLSAACSSPVAPSEPVSGGPSAPILFRKEGAGAAEFLLPSGVTHVRITGKATMNSCHYFSVFIEQRLAAQAILGTCEAAKGLTYEGEYTALGPTVNIQKLTPDNNIHPLTWVVEEVR